MNYTLKQLSDALAAGQMSSRELTRDYLARIDALNPQLNAFITVDHDGALAAAAARRLQDYDVSLDYRLFFS